MTREQILNNAIKQVTGKRTTDYGKPENNFGVIAGLWSTYLGIDISATDVAMLMSLMKIGRIKSGTATEDSFVDLAGYAACGGEIATHSDVVPAPPEHNDFIDSMRYFNEMMREHNESKKEQAPFFKEQFGDDPVKEPKIGDDWAKEPKIVCANNDFPKGLPTSWSNNAIVDGLIHENWNYDTWLKVVKERGEADWKEFITMYDDEYKATQLIDNRCATHIINYRSTEDVIQWGRNYDEKQKEKNSN